MTSIKSKPSRIESLYKEIREIDATDKCSLPEALCKLTEEHGELIRAANQSFGRKVSDQNKEEIRQDVLEEVADTLQNLLLVSGRYNFTIEEIINMTFHKDLKWKAQIPKRQAKKKTASKHQAKNIRKGNTYVPDQTGRK